MKANRRKADRRVLFTFGGMTMTGCLDPSIHPVRRGYKVVAVGRIAYEVPEYRITAIGKGVES